MRRLLILALLCGTAWGQTLVTIQFGNSYCAAVQRSLQQVQTYCYSLPGPPWVLVHNQIDSISNIGSIIVSWSNKTDCIVWQFDAEGNYAYTTSGSSIITKGVFGEQGRTIVETFPVSTLDTSPLYYEMIWSLQIDNGTPELFDEIVFPSCKRADGDCIYR
jgi:hypothetical protein